MSVNCCGECNICCFVLAVQELNKGSYCPCSHLTDKGCSIYETRFPVCRVYACVWRLGVFELTKEELASRFEKQGSSWWETFAPTDSQYRPDKLGVLFTCSDPAKGLCAYEVRENIDLPKATEALLIINEKLPSSVSSEVKLHRFRKPPIS